MQVLIDRFITLLKWPLALYMLISIPAYIRSLYYFNFVNIKFIVLGAGFILFFIARQMADASVKTSMQIVAHELTHAFFALITFHKVKHIRVEADDSGGSMGFEGEGNWLIIIAPYFFPLFGFFYMLFISVWTSFAPMNLILNGILGYFLGYHMDTVASQIHEKPQAVHHAQVNRSVRELETSVSMLAFNSRGWDGFWDYQTLIKNLNVLNFEYVMKLVF